MVNKEAGADGFIQKVQDVAGGLMGRAGAAITTTARSFVESAAISDLYEIASGELALERASSEEVRAAARMMVDEHQETTRRLRGLIGHDPDLVPPSTMDARRHGMIDHLIQADDFDRAYLDQQVLAHQEAVTLMHSYRDGGDDEALRDFAADAGELVERHLAHMKELRQRIEPI
jgi:putative membrane protein